MIRVAWARIPWANPASSSTVSPFRLSAISVAAICASVALPSSNQLRSCAASARERFSSRIKRGRKLLDLVPVINSSALKALCLEAGLVWHPKLWGGQVRPLNDWQDVYSQPQKLGQQLFSFRRRN